MLDRDKINELIALDKMIEQFKTHGLSFADDPRRVCLKSDDPDLQVFIQLLSARYDRLARETLSKRGD